jgi:hypothetical protein
MVVVSRVASAEDMRRFLGELDVRGRTYVVKPNWGNACDFTSAQTLDWLLSALAGKAKVIEGYTAWRNELNVGPVAKDVITPSNAKAKWRWIKEQDEWFLRFSGIDKVLAEHRVEYINVTEEVWSDRVLEPEETRDLVDTRYGMLTNQELYRVVPAKLYELRGSTLISLNYSRQMEGGVSLSTKNIFGLIPHPARYGKWHGKNDSRLPRSIVEINKVYRSLFSPCYWINEIKGRGVFVGSRNSVEADAVTARLMGVDPEQITYLRHVAGVFGDYDRSVLTQIQPLEP